jgi:hypothetical protein
MVSYKGYLILGEALKIHPDWWRSQGTVYMNNPEGYIHVKQRHFSSPKKLPKRTASNSVKRGWTKI